MEAGLRVKVTKLLMTGGQRHRQYSTSLYMQRKWQPTPVLLPGKSQGWRSLVG